MSGGRRQVRIPQQHEAEKSSGLIGRKRRKKGKESAFGAFGGTAGRMRVRACLGSVWYRVLIGIGSLHLWVEATAMSFQREKEQRNQKKNATESLTHTAPRALLT
jgi:hypothetical protein